MKLGTSLCALVLAFGCTSGEPNNGGEELVVQQPAYHQGFAPVEGEQYNRGFRGCAKILDLEEKLPIPPEFTQRLIDMGYATDQKLVERLRSACSIEGQHGYGDFLWIVSEEKGLLSSRYVEESGHVLEIEGWSDPCPVFYAPVIFRGYIPDQGIFQFVDREWDGVVDEVVQPVEPMSTTCEVKSVLQDLYLQNRQEFEKSGDIGNLLEHAAIVQHNYNLISEAFGKYHDPVQGFRLPCGVNTLGD